MVFNRKSYGFFLIGMKISWRFSVSTFLYLPSLFASLISPGMKCWWSPANFSLAFKCWSSSFHAYQAMVMKVCLEISDASKSLNLSDQNSYPFRSWFVLPLWMIQWLRFLYLCLDVCGPCEMLHTKGFKTLPPNFKDEMYCLW